MFFFKCFIKKIVNLNECSSIFDIPTYNAISSSRDISNTLDSSECNILDKTSDNP